MLLFLAGYYYRRVEILLQNERSSVGCYPEEADLGLELSSLSHDHGFPVLLSSAIFHFISIPDRPVTQMFSTLLSVREV